MRTYERSWWCVKEKKQKMALLLITFTVMLHFQIQGCVGCVETERIGLLELKSYLTSPRTQRILNSWSNDDRSSDCCLWERVKCSDVVGGRIVDLSLDGLMNTKSLNLSLLHRFPLLQSLNFSYNGFNNLFDPIHGYKSFQRLETLDLSHNGLDNSIVPFLSATKSLKTLNLGYNSLKGVFPPKELANMTELKVLDLQYNKFSLFSAQGLINFRELEELDLSYNGIDSVQAGTDLMLHSSLQVLNLEGNQLSLTPKGYSEICRLLILRELHLGSNALKSMPYCLGNLTRLRTLELSYNQLDGDLSSFVSSLPSTLEYLSLVQNSFNGSFSFNSLVNHTRLTVFKLSSNVGMIQPQSESSLVPLFQLKILMLQNLILGSTMPSFLVYQRDLCFVDLSNNMIEAFPTWLVQNNTRLQMLLLNSNSLIKLQLPRISHGLKVLDISSNRISDSVREDIGIIFPNLRYMNFASNHFQGTIPSSMGEMKSLGTLDMSSNDLSGRLPTTFLSGCYLLWFLKLSNNKFEGEIFLEEANLTSLLSLALDGNKFSGSLGKGLLNSKDTSILDLSNNSISDALPPWIGGFSRLKYVNMRGNQLKGLIPRQLQKLQSLQVIDISHNSLCGSIPKSFVFPKLIELRLQRNEFMGTIPSTLFKTEGLVVLDLGNNNFSGKIPNTIGKSSSLHVLLLGNNVLQSHIPESICQLSKVNLLDLSHNRLEGIIPSCFFNMSFGANHAFSLGGYLESSFLKRWKYRSAFSFDFEDVIHFYLDQQDVINYIPTAGLEFVTKSRSETYQGDVSRLLYGLDLSSNQLSGDIPNEIGNLHHILSLNLSGNRFTGSIPDSFSKLKDLESLDISNNKLDGNIPPQLANLNNIGFFNVSRNNLSGEIPIKGHLLTFDERSYISNPHLCGRPTNISCTPTKTQEQSVTDEEEEVEVEENDGVIDMEWFYWTCGAVYISTALSSFAFVCIDTPLSRKWFYHTDLMVHHLHRFKDRFVCN